MEPPGVPGAHTFQTSGETYDAFMGRYSLPLAESFADASALQPGLRALDVGCGAGALTGILVDRLSAEAVCACDPAPPFASECARRHPGVEVRAGRAEAIPFVDDSFDRVLAQLVLQFVSDPEQSAREFRRVVRPGGTVSACVWDAEDEMEMLRHFWDAALATDPSAPSEARALRFGAEGEIVALFAHAGFEDLRESTVTVTSTYADFDELWTGFLAGIGPAGAYCLSLSEESRAALREDMFDRLESPTGAFTLSASARWGSGRAPSDPDIRPVDVAAVK